MRWLPALLLFPDCLPTLPDADGDGFLSYEVGGPDCDDGDPLVHPGAPESCNARDDDCDGRVDEKAIDAITWYADMDEDLYGDPFSDVVACEPPAAQWQTNGDDCDDADASVHPGAVEACDDIDSDCDGWITDGCPETDCANGKDDDYDGLTDCEDGDCIGPACDELCDDGVDNDTDGLTDCDDDDCWGWECHPDGVHLVVLDGHATIRAERTIRSHEECKGPFTWFQGRSWIDITATSVTGQLVVAPDGEKWSTATHFTSCTFSIPAMTAHATWFEDTSFGTWIAAVDGRTLTLAPGCRFDETDLEKALPARLAPGYHRNGAPPLYAWPQRWYTGTVLAHTQAASTTTSYQDCTSLALGWHMRKTTVGTDTWELDLHTGETLER